MTGKSRALRAAYPQDPAGRFTRSEPQAVPDIAFNDADGRQVRLSDWRGELVLLNIWATWCAPCKTELPSLDRLQAKLGGKEFTVLALSTDRGGPGVTAQFFEREGITHLKVFNDNSGEAAIRMKEPGLPLSIVLNENGQEIARLFGSIEWDSPEIIAQLEAWKSRNANGRGTARPSL
jgi:thiol-disulfide isomerase/thioredoxin